MGLTFEKLKDVVESNEKQRFSLSHISQVPTEEELAKGVSAAGTTKGESLSAKQADPSAATDSAEGKAPAEIPIATPTEKKEIPADAPPEEFLIRANQGHSLPIQSLHLLTPLTPDSPDLPAQVCHGTFIRFFPAILSSGGLSKMGRTHVHFFREEALTGGNKAVSGMRGDAELVVYVDVRRAMDAGLKFWVSDNGVILSEGDEKGFVRTDMWSKVTERGGEVIWMPETGLLKELGEGKRVIGKERLERRGGGAGRGGRRDNGKPRGPPKDRGAMEDILD